MGFRGKRGRAELPKYIQRKLQEVVEPEIPYVQPVWTEKQGKQQKQMHFNFQVDDLPAAVEETLRLGAKKANICLTNLSEYDIL